MPKSTTFSNDLIALIFNAAAIANLADNAGSSPATNLYVSLHTASPGVGGSQLTNEAAYTNYARVAVTRTAGGWTVSGGVASNVGLIQFPQCGVTGATITHVAIGTASSGAGKVLYQGALNSSLAVANLIQPQFAAAALTATES
ncbi:MAG: hypothetical protein JNK15_23770 [Planctomycetes bacterium]|nr:hypothetical protein [Planctomycetota bacterium]